jgi:hypothetical protein
MIEMRSTNIRTRLTVFVVALLVAALVVALPYKARVGARQKPAFNFAPYARSVPNIDPSLAASALRQPTNVQLAAAQNLKSNYGQQLSVRWNNFAGTPDALTNFHTPPSAATPEATARAFVNSNSTLFGVSADSLALVSQQEALGGYLLRFQQKVNGVDVAGGGLGFLMNSQKQIRMIMGSTFRDVSINGSTALDAAAATNAATQALAQYAASVPAAAEQLQAPAYDELAKQLAPALRAPRLNVYPTADGYRLAWNVITFSRNPFGLFVSQIDAATGEVIARENLVRAQTTEVLPYTADIYPNHPKLKNPDTGELALDAAGEPDGLKRVQLRGYNPGTNLTGANGLLSGPHALIKNVLAVQQPFPQATAGTFHFRQNNAPLEAQPNEADDFAEPAEHIDDVNIFFFINYLLEYVDDVHRRDDTVNNRIGTGSFPDTYPNYDRPLVGLPHFPNDCGQAGLGGPCDTSSADALKGTVLGLDNAFSLPVVETVDTPVGPQKIVVNPTVYGHGYAFNDLGKDGAVCYHEGMHSISTPIAGLEGAPEGSALNEAQADLWAYTITDAEAIGEYVAAGAGIRKEFRDAGRDPDSLAWIRSVHSTIKYSQLGSRGAAGAFEEHRDGEIFVATMWDLRYLMTNAWPQKQFYRPAFIDGKPTRQISLGQEMWERDFLGSLYILGLTSPDTFVKARDAMIMADRILYPSDATDLEAPGQHEALIWQVYAAHEIGLNAQAPLGGRQTISTAVPQFALSQAHLGAPQGVSVEVGAQGKSIKVNWQPVAGAVAYEVFKRKIGSAGQRQFKGVAGREYFDGDNQTTGWSHISFVANGQTTYEDSGKIEEFFAPAGIKSTNDATGFNPMFDTEYAVRAVSINANRQAGFGDLSGGASLAYSFADVTNAIRTANSNFSFADGKFEFDQAITNATGTAGADARAYAPIDFRIVSISDPTVTAANADNGGDGHNKPASYVYNQSLDAGQTSAARRLSFNDAAGQLFSFDAVVTARVRGASAVVNGSQPYDGDGGGRAAINLTSTTDTYSGLIVVGSAGSQIADGVDYVDVPFVAKAGAFGVQGTLTATPNGGAAPDLDFALLDDQGHVLDTSGNLGPNESVGGGITPGKTYVYRVIGYASGPAQFTITSQQFVNAGAGGTSSTSSTGGSSLLGSMSTTATGTSGFLAPRTGVSAPTHLVRFTVNPKTGAVTASVIR